MIYRPSSPPPQARQAQGPSRRPTFTQYQGVDQSALLNKGQNVVSGMLDNPGTMNPQVLAQMKARQKEQALALAEQTKSNAQAQMASSGFSANGGMRVGANRAVDMGTVNSILAGNRDLDVTAAQTNRQDAINALAAAGQFTANRSAINAQDYASKLAGEGAQADSDFRLDSFVEDQRRYDGDFGLKSWTAQETANQASADSELRALLGAHGINLDMLNFGEGQRQFNNEMGFRYSNLNANQNSQLKDYLLRALG